MGCFNKERDTKEKRRKEKTTKAIAYAKPIQKKKKKATTHFSLIIK